MEKVYYSGCLIELRDGRILLQQRDSQQGLSAPGMISTFGGRQKAGESAIAAGIRELYEETGLLMASSSMIFVGYLERYDEWKSHIVGATYYLVRIGSPPRQVFEGQAVLVSGDDLLEHEGVGPVTKEMYRRMCIARIAGIIPNQGQYG